MIRLKWEDVALLFTKGPGDPHLYLVDELFHSTLRFKKSYYVIKLCSRDLVTTVIMREPSFCYLDKSAMLMFNFFACVTLVLVVLLIGD